MTKRMRLLISAMLCFGCLVNCRRDEGTDDIRNISLWLLLNPARTLYLASYENDGNARPMFIRCALDGSSCLPWAMGPDQGRFAGLQQSLVLDRANEKVLGLTMNQSNQGRPGLFRCELDGGPCSHTDLSADQPISSGASPTLLVDQTDSKLLAITNNSFSNNGKPALFRCDMDGSGCTHFDLSAGQGNNSALDAAAVLDSVNRKILVATFNTANSGKPSLFRCNMDGTGCTHSDISAGQPANSGWRPTIAIDPINSRILVVTEFNDTASKAALFRCELDGTGCVYVDISAGQPAGSAENPALIVDPVNKKLIVVATNSVNEDKPSMYRCELDGSACEHTDISHGMGAGSGFSATLRYDAELNRLMIAVQNAADQRAPYLLFCSPDGLLCRVTNLSPDYRARGTSGNHPAIARL